MSALPEPRQTLKPKPTGAGKKPRAKTEATYYMAELVASKTYVYRDVTSVPVLGRSHLNMISG